MTGLPPWVKSIRVMNFLALVFGTSRGTTSCSPVVSSCSSQPSSSAVLSISPGPMIEPVGGATEEELEVLRKLTLLKRLGLREEGYFREASYFKGAWHDDVIAAMLASEWRERFVD